MFYRQQAVVFCDALRAAKRAGLDLTCAGANRKVRDESILGFPGTMRNDRAIVGFLCHRHRLQRFGHCADLIQLNEDCVGDPVVDALSENLWIGNEVVVADQLQPVAERIGQLLPAFTVFFTHAVFKRHDGVLLRPLGVKPDHLGGRLARTIRFLEHVVAGIVKLAGGRVERNGDVLARLVAGCTNGLDDQLHRFIVGLQAGREPAFITHGGHQAALLQKLL